MAGLGLIACGCAVKYFLGEILRSGVVDLITKSAFALFVRNTPVPKSIDFGPFTDTVGVVLIVLGAFVLALSVIGCLAVCCSFRVLLLTVSSVTTTMMMMMTMTTTMMMVFFFFFFFSVFFCSFCSACLFRSFFLSFAPDVSLTSVVTMID